MFSLQDGACDELTLAWAELRIFQGKDREGLGDQSGGPGLPACAEVRDNPDL